VRGAASNGRPYRDVRRETGKEYVVRVHCDEGVAIPSALSRAQASARTSAKRR